MKARFFPCTIAIVAALAIAGCAQPSRCGARGESCCADGCFDSMVCHAGLCRGPCMLALGCDYVQGTGCSPGVACRRQLDASGGPMGRCDGAIGTGSERSPCSGDEQCGAGLFCDPELGECRFYCCADARDCPRAQYCGGVEPTGFCIGDDGCDYWTNTGCAPGLACYPAIARDAPTALCRTPGLVPAGGSCEADDCASGSICILQTEGTLVCRAICDPMHPCASGEDCTELMGHTFYGTCR